jgi:hypothetical protein
LTKFAAKKSRFGGQELTLAMVQLHEATPSQRSNIPQTALVATLDTYDFFKLNIMDYNKEGFGFFIIRKIVKR